MKFNFIIYNHTNLFNKLPLLSIINVKQFQNIYINSSLSLPVSFLALPATNAPCCDYLEFVVRSRPHHHVPPLILT